MYPPCFDVIIIGGSYAGLSAALALGRSLRTTLVVDHGLPCNRQTPHSHNFLTQDGRTPQEITALAHTQVSAYDTIFLHSGKALGAAPTEDGFSVRLSGGAVFEARKLILATGIKDRFPEIPGFSACWGISVIHCPYCHGYEFRQRRTAIHANGETAYHLASLVHHLTDDLVIIPPETPDLTVEQQQLFHHWGIPILAPPIREIHHKNGHVTGVRLQNGQETECSAIYARPSFVQATEIPAELGCAISEQGYIQTDPFQKTTVHGVFACGDNSSPLRSVAQAVATGNSAGAIANMELCRESFTS